MLHDNMNISHLMVHARRVEEERDQRMSRDVMSATSYEGGATNNMLEIQEKPRFKKRFSSKVPSKFLRLLMIRCKSLRPKREGVGTHQLRILHVPSVERVIFVNAG